MTRVPELRFDGFAGEWEENIFDNLAEYKKGPFGSALKKSIFVSKSNETVKVYEQQNAIEKDWELERYFITREYANKMENFNVGPGDLIVSCAGTIGEMYELPNSAEEGIINQALMRIRVKDAIDKRFFNHIFDKMIRKSSARLSNGSAIKNIPPFSDLKPHKTYVPIYNEQEKIGDLFSKIDQLIESQQELVDQTVAFKKSMLQKMFPKKDSLVPEIRFDGFKFNWEIRKVKDLLDYEQPTKYIVSNDDYIEEGIPVLTANKSFLLGYTDEENYYDNGEVILIDDFTLDSKYVDFKFMVKSSALKILTPKDSNLFFMFNLLNNTKFITEGHKRHYISIIQETNVAVPSLEEQEKIGNFFKKLDEKIVSEEKLLESYKDMKKSLLQKMFV